MQKIFSVRKSTCHFSLYISPFAFSRDRTFTAYKLLLRLVPQLKSVIQDPELTVLNTFLSNVKFLHLLTSKSLVLMSNASASRRC